MHTATTAVCALASAMALAFPAAAGPLDLEHGGQRLLDQVNRGVNGAYAPLTPFADPNGDGVWDCENYAAEKMARLAAAGVPEADLELWRVTTPRGVSHAVLVVRGSRRGRPVDLVLDNLSAWTVRREALPYTDWAPLQLDWRATSATGRR